MDGVSPVDDSAAPRSSYPLEYAISSSERGDCDYCDRRDRDTDRVLDRIPVRSGSSANDLALYQPASAVQTIPGKRSVLGLTHHPKLAILLGLR